MNLSKFVTFSVLTLLSMPSYALDYDYGKEVIFKRPKRIISIIVDKYAYYPEKITVFAGEEVDFILTGTDSKAGCFMMPEKKIFISAIRGEISKASAVFETPGIHKFYCPKGHLAGSVTVLLHPSDERRRELREIASKKVIKVWRPREE